MVCILILYYQRSSANEMLNSVTLCMYVEFGNCDMYSHSTYLRQRICEWFKKGEEKIIIDFCSLNNEIYTAKYRTLFNLVFDNPSVYKRWNSVILTCQPHGFIFTTMKTNGFKSYKM